MGMLSSWVLPASLAVTLGADQVLKGCIIAGLRAGQLIALGPSVRIRPARPHWTAAGRFGVRPLLLSFAWLACLLAVLLVAPHAGRFDGSLSQAALGAALGGAAGNLVDILVRKGVVDYVELGAWPAFNLADVAIVSGVIVALMAG